MKEKRASLGATMPNTEKGVAVSDGKLSKSEPKDTRAINTGLSNEDRAAVADLLQSVLANTSLVYVKTRNYHWNVTGPRFHTLHLFLETQYTALAESADEVAERIRSLGAFPIGTMAEFIERGDLQEEPGVRPPADGMILSLLNDHETIIRGLREDIDKCDDEHNDAGTADFLTALLEAHEKMAWMLRSHLEDHEPRDDA
jgi:starvation-inducible DNA-binding protein